MINNGFKGPNMRNDMIFELKRPKPLLPDSLFWTWDHSTNWTLDDPGFPNEGCYNRYTKKPGTFLKDYMSLIDFCSGLGISGIIIYGFLRDSHGGIGYSKQIADHGSSKGVKILPGVGTTWYGGPYYEGSHYYNMESFLKNNPDLIIKDEKGAPLQYAGTHGLCPSNHRCREWIREGIKWLFDEFSIDGINLENGDFVVCYCPECREHKEKWPAGDPDFFRHQALGYEEPLKTLAEIKELRKDILITWATYTGFLPGMGEPMNQIRQMDGLHLYCDRPAIFDKLGSLEVAQWTISHMINKQPLPLLDFLDEGIPPKVYCNENWPVNLRPPSQRSIGFMHQGSQWSGASRYDQVISSIKEACLRSYDSGLKGLVIHGEVSPQHIPAALNYLAFSHFTHWPQDSLREFGRKTLGQIFEDEKEGELYAQILAFWDSKKLEESHISTVNNIWNRLEKYFRIGSSEETDTNYRRSRFWYWLRKMVNNIHEEHTVSIF